jgi:hypothetical protein
MSKQQEKITTIVERALASTEGRQRLAVAEALMVEDCQRNRFNTERAIQVYTVAIDNIVATWMKPSQFKRTFYREYRRSGIKVRYAKKLVAEFKRGRGGFGPIKDQRRPRRLLRFLLGP